MSKLSNHLVNENAAFFGDSDRGLKFYSLEKEEGHIEDSDDKGKSNQSKIVLNLRFFPYRIQNSTFQ